MNKDTKSLGSFDAIDLFDLLRDGRAYTLSDLAELTGRARSTVALRLADLENAGLVAPLPQERSTGGRPPTRIAFNPSAWGIIAADIGLSHARAALMDLSGKVIADTRFDAPMNDGPTAVLDSFIETATGLVKVGNQSGQRVAAVGIGLPLPVFHDDGRPVNPTNLPEWDGFDVPAYVAAAFDVPVLVDNDANIMALGEHTMWPGVDEMILVKASTGIGSGIISQGGLLRGQKGTAGAIGHIPISRGGDIACICGNRGCLVALASGPAIVSSLRANGVEADNVDDLVDLARTGNLETINALRQAGNDIGEILTTCISMLNPAVIAVGGRLAVAGDHLLAGIREAVYNKAAPFATDGLQIVRSAAADDAGILGAGLMATTYALSRENLRHLLGAEEQAIA